MNIALWLQRAGLSDPDRPALATGKRVVRTYGALAQRTARLAGALRDRLRIAPGDRVAIIAKNGVEYVEALYAIWHAGAAAVPINAKLHPSELAYILEHAGARACFASSGIDMDIAPHTPASLEHLIAIGREAYEALQSTDPIAQTGRAVFPHPAFTKTLSSEWRWKGSARQD